MANVLYSLIVEDMTATIELPNPFSATSLHVDWGDGTVEDFTTLAGATIPPQTFDHTYTTVTRNGTFTASATGYDSVSIPGLPSIGALIIDPSEVSNVEASLTPYNLSTGLSFVNPDTLIWNDTAGGTLWNADQWNAEWAVACVWKPDSEPFPTNVPCTPYYLDDGTINVTVVKFDDPNRNEGPGTLTFTVQAFNSTRTTPDCKTGEGTKAVMATSMSTTMDAVMINKTGAGCTN